MPVRRLWERRKEEEAEWEIGSSETVMEGEERAQARVGRRLGDMEE